MAKSKTDPRTPNSSPLHAPQGYCAFWLVLLFCTCNSTCSHLALLKLLSTPLENTSSHLQQPPCLALKVLNPPKAGRRSRSISQHSCQTQSTDIPSPSCPMNTTPQTSHLLPDLWTICLTIYLPNLQLWQYGGQSLTHSLVSRSRLWLSYPVWEAHAHLVHCSSISMNEVLLLLEEPLQVHFCRASLPEKINTNPPPFIWIVENVEIGRLYGRDSEKYNWLLNTCYWMSVGNKHQTDALQNLPDLICLQLQDNHKYSPGIAHQRVLALITTEQPLQLMFTQDCLTQGLPKWTEIMICQKSSNPASINLLKMLKEKIRHEKCLQGAVN